MKKIDLKLQGLLLISILFASCHNIIDVKRFKDGTFRSNTKGVAVATIKRTGAFQTEIVNGRPDAIVNVKWIDSITYILTPTHEVIKRDKVPANAMVTVKITGTTDSSYFCRVTNNFNDQIFDAEYVKVQ